MKHESKTLIPAGAHWTARFAACLLAFSALTVFPGCMGDDDEDDAGTEGVANTLFIAHNGGNLISYDIATGNSRPGEIPDMKGPTDMQILKDGTVMVNLTESNEILIVDGKTMLEKARLPSSTIGANRPVHSFLTNEIGGKQYWVTMNDGDGTAASNSVRFLHITPGHADYLKHAGESGLGVGHHKAAWSTTRERVVISNIADPEDVMSVFDYSDIGNIRKIKTLDWKAAGLDSGKSASPHGCATAKSSGKGYCNLTGNGTLVAVDMNADDPSFKLIKTNGTGGGYTAGHPGGRYIYSVQSKPREGDLVLAGVPCQIGQIAVIDAETDSLVKELPLLYKGGDCTDSIASGEAKAASPSHLLFNHEGDRAFVIIGGGAGASRMEGVLDVSDPGNPRQLASAGIGASGSRAQTMDGEGRSVFVLNATDGTVSQLDASSGSVQKTITVDAAPKALATYGDDEGPGYQTGPAH